MTSCSIPVLGQMAMPEHFRYKETFLRGKPFHDPYDPFRCRHPSMDVRRRAKLFAPFDALRGFRDGIHTEEMTALGFKDVEYLPLEEGA